MGSKFFNRRCKICGREFESQNKKKKYCSLECINKAYKLPPPKQPNKHLDEIARQALQCGLSYGKYRALLDMGRKFEELRQV